jgi:hypothetical protein
MKTDELAELRAELAAQKKELAELKGAQPAPPFDAEANRKSTAEWADEMHQARERAANSFQFSPAVLKEMNAACGTADLRDLVHASHAPRGPSQAGVPSSSTITGVHPGGGARGTGWVDAAPLGPPPGLRYVDAQLDAQDNRDHAQRIAEEARTQAVRKAMEPK